jgi:hypothetical protein
MSEFMRLNIGPVVMKDEIGYVKEVLLLEEITVTLSLAGLAEDGSRWILRSDIIRPDGKLAARVNSTGGWLDLGARKLIAPPPALITRAAAGKDRGLRRPAVQRQGEIKYFLCSRVLKPCAFRRLTASVMDGISTV